MSPLLKDAGSSFWIGSLGKVPFFFDAQRCYIEAEINRMKTVSVVHAGSKSINLKGLSMEHQDRVSTITFNIFKQVFHSIFYCLYSLKVIKPEEASLFKDNNLEEVKNSIWSKQQ